MVLTKLYTFLFENNKIMIITDTENKYWFSGINLGNILEYNNIRKALNKHIPSKYKKSYSELSSDKKLHGQTIFISEAGLYRLVMKSKQENAIEFQDWITDIILPELREKGLFKLNNEIYDNVSKLLTKYKNMKDEIKNLKNLLHKNKHLKNGIVYVKNSETINNKINYKIGSTLDSEKRERVYKTGHIDTSEYIYYIEIINPKLTETIIKDKLYKYKINPTTEIFNCSLDTIKKVFNKTKELIEMNLDEEIMSDTDNDLEEKELVNTIKKTIKKNH